MRLCLIAWMMLSTAAAFAQSFNIDFTTLGGSLPGTGTPSAAFPGAAGQPGPWNAILTGSGIPLVNTNSQLTNVIFSRQGNGTIANHNTGILTGDIELLLEDMFRGDPGVPIIFEFDNLQAGTYALYTYAVHPGLPETGLVTVAGSSSQADQVVGGVMGSSALFIGATHSLHVLNVSAGGGLDVVIEPPAPNVRANIGGMQLVRLNGSKLRMHVDFDAAGADHGATWADAFSHLTTALTNARAAGGQHSEVWVANGIYKPTTGPSRERTFDVPNHLKLYGGFGGAETSLEQRNPGGSLTYLDGNIGSAASPFDNSYTVVDASNTAPDTLIDGFRIVHGFNDAEGPDGSNGAGLRLQNGSATVRNCTFEDNKAEQHGGAVYSSGGAPTFVDCFFHNNHAANAGDGGAIHHAGPALLRAYNCRFTRNLGHDGGAAYFADADGLFANCVFNGNQSFNDGGAAHAHGAASSVTLSNCTIAGNEATHYAGGAFGGAGGGLAVHNCIFWDNMAGAGGSVLEEQLMAVGGGFISDFFTSAQGAPGVRGADPLFVNAEGADGHYGTLDDELRLAAGSPCIDAGMSSLIATDGGDLNGDGDLSEPVPFDLNGRPRRVDDFATTDTGFGPPPMVDRGAFEFEPFGLHGDMNCDGVVNNFDIDPFVLALTSPAAYEATFSDCDITNGDINEDESVNNFDIDPFVICLTNGGCP